MSRDWELPPVDDPLRALAELAGEILGWKDYLSTKVAALNGELEYWTDEDHAGATDEAANPFAVHENRVRAVVELYMEALRDSTRILLGISKANVDERLATIRETQVAIMARLLVESLSRAGINDPDQVSRVREEFAVLADREAGRQRALTVAAGSGPVVLAESKP